MRAPLKGWYPGQGKSGQIIKRCSEFGIRKGYRLHSGEAMWGVIYPLALIVFGLVSGLIFLFA